MGAQAVVRGHGPPSPPSPRSDFKLPFGYFLMLNYPISLGVDFWHLCIREFNK